MSFLDKAIDLFTGGLGEKVGDIIDQLVPDKDLRRRLKQELDMTRLIGKQKLELARVQSDRDVQLAIEKTHQAALNQSDLKTKRTRPLIARQSWYLAGGYAFMHIFSTLLAAFTVNVTEIEFDSVVFGTLAGPALWYMGMRGFDKWKNRDA